MLYRVCGLFDRDSRFDFLVDRIGKVYPIFNVNGDAEYLISLIIGEVDMDMAVFANEPLNVGAWCSAQRAPTFCLPVSVLSIRAIIQTEPNVVAAI